MFDEKLSRRTFAAGLAALPFVADPVIAAESTIETLIAKHSTAAAAYMSARAEQERAEEYWFAKKNERDFAVPILSACDVRSPIDRDFLRVTFERAEKIWRVHHAPKLTANEISSSHGKQSIINEINGVYNARRIAVHRPEAQSPDQKQEALTAIDALEAENLALAERLFEAAAAREAASPYGRACAACTATGADEVHTIEAVVAYRCRDMSEARRKAEYLMTCQTFVDDFFELEMMRGFVESFLHFA